MPWIRGVATSSKTKSTSGRSAFSMACSPPLRRQLPSPAVPAQGRGQRPSEARSHPLAAREPMLIDHGSRIDVRTSVQPRCIQRKRKRGLIIVVWPGRPDRLSDYDTACRVRQPAACDPSEKRSCAFKCLRVLMSPVLSSDRPRRRP
jgi:hypothetical protein